MALTPLLRRMTGQLAPSLTFQSAAGDRPLVFRGKKTAAVQSWGFGGSIDVDFSCFLRTLIFIPFQ